MIKFVNIKLTLKIFFTIITNLCYSITKTALIYCKICVYKSVLKLDFILTYFI